MYGKLEIPFSSTPSPILTESSTTNGTVALAACAALTRFSPVLVRLPSTNDTAASYGVNQRSVGMPAAARAGLSSSLAHSVVDQ